MIKIREYKTGDAEKIYNLFSQHTPYQRDADYWVWINRMLSENKSLISVAEKNDKIIGHYAIIPRKCVIGNRVLNVGLGIHAFIEPESRNQISIFEISSYAYGLAKEKGYDFLYGFPNQNYRLVQEKIEKWKKVGLFNAFEKESDKNINKNTNFDWELVHKNNFKNLFFLNEIIENTEINNNNYFLKPLFYLVNRYILHPQNLYQTWLLKKEENYIGFVVTKEFNTDNENRAHIIDYGLNSNYNLVELIDDFEVKFSNKVDKFVLWPTNENLKLILIEKEYKATGFDTFFGIKIISDLARELADNILNFNDWFLCMGDSDAF